MYAALKNQAIALCKLPKQSNDLMAFVWNMVLITMIPHRYYLSMHSLYVSMRLQNVQQYVLEMGMHVTNLKR